MRNRLACVTAALAILSCAGRLDASPILAYSFEGPGHDGFFGLGATVSQESVFGVTEGTYSLKYAAGAAGFIGGRTETVIPADLNDPPGVTHVLFDLTLVDTIAVGFADIGITLFGHALNAPAAEFGHQVQFLDTVSISGLTAGTHSLSIALTQSLGPYRAGESFNDIFGPGVTDLTVASAFQFFVSKTVGTTFSFYLDNVRLESGVTATPVPEPASLLLLGTGIAGIAARVRRRKK